MSTEAQITANRINAKRSTGPTSPEGKAVSRMNAVKHGIDARVQFFPGEDPELFSLIADDYRQSWQPQGADEIHLVDTLISADWRQRRYDRIEAITIRNVMDSNLPPDEALAKVYADAAAKANHPLAKLQKAQAAAQRDWFKALSQLQRLQKLRRAQPRLPSAVESVEIGETNPIPPAPMALEPLLPASPGEPEAGNSIK